MLISLGETAAIVAEEVKQAERGCDLTGLPQNRKNVRSLHDRAMVGASS